MILENILLKTPLEPMRDHIFVYLGVSVMSS